ncbi:predicted protein [Pyrenophora tritici-repentis Pt-1C-BFP]|uniref:Uncharacterized protein n=1 Tax=Pyrenophora tritici-repentis (strain Pt-1C-BFP) TaxID=426418 RepID=B2VUR9_PYRTR|nr:uncharacterized protein PTRG_02173 [Pyrenophora tritici-repentis Pt-1C-BFP]EDU41611.1 predicted protein [Pyrenophora tritici-repentis Pt-1C-BFP]
MAAVSVAPYRTTALTSSDCAPLERRVRRPQYVPPYAAHLERAALLLLLLPCCSNRFMLLRNEQSAWHRATFATS